MSTEQRHERQGARLESQTLTATGAAPCAYRVSQGARLGRAASIEITADADGAVWVSGAAVCVRGAIAL
ncbi:hypothetical protein [Streptomyces sp. NPDC002491]